MSPASFEAASDVSEAFEPQRREILSTRLIVFPPTFFLKTACETHMNRSWMPKIHLRSNFNVELLQLYSELGRKRPTAIIFCTLSPPNNRWGPGPLDVPSALDVQRVSEFWQNVLHLAPPQTGAGFGIMNTMCWSVGITEFGCFLCCIYCLIWSEQIASNCTFASVEISSKNLWIWFSLCWSAARVLSSPGHTFGPVLTTTSRIWIHITFIIYMF